MSEKSPVYVGIDLLRSAGRQSRAYVYAALDETRALIALGTGDRNEVLAYLGGQAAAHIAIAAPNAPNTQSVNDPKAYPEGQTPLARKVNTRSWYSPAGTKSVLNAGTSAARLVG